MKYLAIASILLSGYGFWQWLNRPESDLTAEASSQYKKVEEINIQMAAPEKKIQREVLVNKNVEKQPQVFASQDKDKYESKDLIDRVEKVPQEEDRVLFELSNSGIDLEDISHAMEILENSDGWSQDEYVDELISLLPWKTREMMEDLIESKMIDINQLKDFFDKYVNRGMHSNDYQAGRYPGHENIYREIDDF